jgi:hypothetical protein
LQQTSNGFAPILDRDHSPNCRHHTAKPLATHPKYRPRQPTTNRINNPPIQCARPASATHPPAVTPGKQNARTLQGSTLLTPTPRIELYRPCKPSRNLLTCPDFSASQPRGPASIPHMHSLPCCTPEWDCPCCGDLEPDLRYKRLCKFRAAGIKVGRDASREGRGLELGVGCCGVM